MNLREVQIELERIREDFIFKAHESGDFPEENLYTYRIEVIEEALEYLWQYEDLME